MTQRNPLNPRNQNKPKGTTRKSASSAKPVREAASSVRSAPAPTSRKQRQQEKKEHQAADRAERQQERRREQVLTAEAMRGEEYKKWRKQWWIVIVIAIVGVGLSWLFSAGVRNGVLPESFSQYSNAVSIIGLIIGYGGIIYAFYIDFKKIRPIRKAQEERARNLTKKEREQLDAAIAESEAAYEAEASNKNGSKLPWNRKKKADEDSEPAEADTK